MLEFRVISENDIERIKKALNYSKFRGCEYCFANNFAWRRLADSRITFFEDFYIVCAFDTESGYPEFTYPSGKGDICKVVKEMQDFSEKNNSPLIINSVSEKNLEFFREYYGNRAKITSEGDFDYIYSREALAELKGKKYHGKRNHIKRFKEMYDYENSHDYFGGSLVKFKYTGDENIQAEVTKVISATGNTESIVVDTGYCHSFMSNGICSAGNGWDDYEAYLLKNGEEKGLAITVSSANAKSGDKIEFEVKLVAKPVSNK